MNSTAPARLCTGAIVALLVLTLPTTASACGVCMGQTSDTQIPAAVNGAIFMMLGFIGTMMAGIGGVAFSIARRSRNPLPAHLQLAEMIGSQRSTSL